MAYRRRLEALITAMAKSMLLHIKAAAKARPIEIGVGAQDESPVAALRDAMRRWGKRWIRRLNNASDDIATAFANEHRRNLDGMFKRRLKEAGFTVAFEPTAGMAQVYRAVIAENVNLIKSIPQQFLKDVESSVWQAVMTGGKLGALTSGIQRAYGVSFKRAAFIARDQSSKAKAVMEEQRRSELGIKEAVWMHSHAGKVPRPTHVAMNGKRYVIKAGMYDPAVKKNIWPGTEINCRCTSRAIIPALQ
jgi:SPP1 gp7 family putative phage head morphogenesis protein